MQEYGFTLPEIPKHTELQKHIYSIGRISKDFRQCHAVKGDGKRCGCQSMTFEVFCRTHLLQGFGLFTLAVLARLEYFSPPDIGKDG